MLLCLSSSVSSREPTDSTQRVFNADLDHTCSVFMLIHAISTKQIFIKSQKSPWHINYMADMLNTRGLGDDLHSHHYDAHISHTYTCQMVRTVCGQKWWQISASLWTHPCNMDGVPYNVGANNEKFPIMGFVNQKTLFQFSFTKLTLYRWYRRHWQGQSSQNCIPVQN